jgi:hypothetical protein
MIDQDLRLSVASNREVAVVIGGTDHALTPYGPFPKSWVDRGWVAFCNEAELRVLIVLCVHANTQGGCFPGVKTIAKLSGLAPSGVHAVLNRIEAYGLMTRDQRRGQPTNYILRNAVKSAPQARVPVGPGGRSGSTTPRTVDQGAPRMVHYSTRATTPPSVEESAPPTTPRTVAPNRYVNRILEQTSGGVVERTNQNHSGTPEHVILLERAHQQDVLNGFSADELKAIAEKAIDLAEPSLRHLYVGKDPMTHRGTGMLVVRYLREHKMIT